MKEQEASNILTWQEFENVTMAVGTIIEAESFPKAKNPSYKLKIDFGPLGIKKSSAQLTKLYDKNQLIGKQIVAVMNFPPKQIADFMSECLVLGAIGLDGNVTLLTTDLPVKNGLYIAWFFYIDLF